ncbi:MAG: glycoside hydrolase family 20 zincin-like fold domain-containing protein, partial [Stenotrophomonas maltophilia]|nr:glycoside hydrolase family 20 zincin-like fold domain-containing protein [Stenotrophomonas maltophilia]
MVKPSRARMRSALLGSLIALLPALPALAADPTPATEAPGPQLRTGSLMLIPAPATVQRGQGSGITVRADTALHAEGEAAQRVATQFTDLLARSGGPRLTPAKGKTAAAPGGIRFQIVPTFRDSGESYTLESTAQGVVIQAGNETGLFYGATTLAQLATGGSNGVLPAVQIQ